MRAALGKLGFVHRRLWQRDGLYRVAVLLGPPPLLGVAGAALLWAGLPAMPWGAAAPPPPWAAVAGPRMASSTDLPRAVAPSLPLPPSGVPSDVVTGWQGGIQPVEISQSMDANVLTTRLAPLVLDQPGFGLAQVVAASPAAGRFVGVGNAILVVRTAGVYALTLRVQRTDREPATCLQRLVFGSQRVVSDLELDQPGPFTHSYEPVAFDLQPGLYPIAVAFGCWDDRHEKGAGAASVMVRAPGDAALRLARADEILRSATADARPAGR